jgi:hypothetical protein
LETEVLAVAELPHRRLRDDRPGRVRARLLGRVRRRPRPACHSPGRTLIRPTSAACLRVS